MIIAMPSSVVTLVMTVMVTVGLGSATLTDQQKTAVLDAHNKYRSQANPTAANMKKLVRIIYNKQYNIILCDSQANGYFYFMN